MADLTVVWLVELMAEKMDQLMAVMRVALMVVLLVDMKAA